MKKYIDKLLTFLTVPLILSSCSFLNYSEPSTNASPISFWYSLKDTGKTVFEHLVGEITSEIDFEVTLAHHTNLISDINNSIANCSWPHMAFADPNDIASYVNNEIILDLTPYIQKYNEKHNTNLEADFYEQYMVENKEHQEGKIYGLPFLKYSEMMTYNADLFEYIKSLDSSITKLPVTWDDFMSEGPKYLAALKGQNLFKTDKGDGKGIAAKYNSQGVATEFKLVDKNKDDDYFNVGNDYTLIADFSNVRESEFCVITSDNPDTLFITILKQWGSSYTGYTVEEQNSKSHEGHIEFWNDKYPEYKAKTIEALSYLCELHTASEDTEAHVIDVSTVSLFKIRSSGMINSVNPAVSNEDGKMANPKYNVGLAPIPYKDSEHKYVFSNGSSLSMFDRGLDENKAMEAFEVIAALSTGKNQGEWAAKTGYYPVSKSATTSAVYQEYINTPNPASENYYHVSSQINEMEYMNDNKGWTKFVDKAFIGSSNIRQAGIEIMKYLFDKVDDGEEAENAIQEAMYHCLSHYREYIK